MTVCECGLEPSCDTYVPSRETRLALDFVDSRSILRCYRVLKLCFVYATAIVPQFALRIEVVAEESLHAFSSVVDS